MITRVRVPTLSTNVTEVTLTGWLKEEGDPVRKGEPLAELTTDKATVELESPRSGILRQRLARPKSILPVGYIIALVGSASDPLPDVSRENEQLMARHRAELGLPGPAPFPKSNRNQPRVRATPAARRLARERGIDLEKVAAVLGDRTITETDLADFMKLNTARNPAGTRDPSDPQSQFHPRRI